MNVCIFIMLYFNRIDVSEGIKGFKFQPSFCNRCHDLLMMSINLSKSEAINLMQNMDLTKHYKI